nr:RNAse P domain containing protein [Haemonchus contortus]
MYYLMAIWGQYNNIQIPASIPGYVLPRMDDSTCVAEPSFSKASSSSTATNGRPARIRGKEAAGKREDASRLHVLDSHMRLNLLHQGATHLSCQSKGINDGYAKLARRYVKLFKDVLKTERVKIQPGIGRTFCRKCKQMFVAKVERCKLNFVQRKVMQRTCLLCGYSRNYEWNTGYVSRNEKHWKEEDDPFREEIMQ